MNVFACSILCYLHEHTLITAERYGWHIRARDQMKSPVKNFEGVYEVRRRPQEATATHKTPQNLKRLEMQAR